MRRRLVSVLLALVLVPLLAGQALAIGTLDQEVLPGGTLLSAAVTPLWQTFTAGRTGNLDTVALYGSTGVGSTWNVAIRAVSGGVPSGPNLATGSAPAPGPDSWTDIALTPAIPVFSGTMYAIVVSPPTPSWAPAAAPYAGGSGNVIADFAFRTFVTPPLAVSLASLSPTEGTAFNGTVATFTATNTSLTASAFTATIDWGDGTTSSGTITGSAGSFSVNASGLPHTYADESTPLSWSVSVTETAFPFTGSGTGTVTVAEGDVLSAPTLNLVSAVEGVVVNGTVATFTDANTNNVASDFTATIDWGDGTTSAGTVTGSAGTLSVAGSHTYADEGLYSVSVTLTDDSPGTATATASGTVNVTEGDLLSGTLVAITPVYQTPFSGTVATFTDTYTGNVASDFTATIAWGDGTATPGTVSGGSGSFDVSGSHTYAAAGVQPLNMVVTLTDDAPGTAIGSIAGLVTVTRAPSLTALSVVPSTVTFGQETFTITATVSPVAPGGGTPTGTVTLSVGATAACTSVALVSGTATCTLNWVQSLAPNPSVPYVVTGVYGGDASFQSSTGATSLTVLPQVQAPPPPQAPPAPIDFTLTKGVGISQAGPFGTSLTAPLGATVWYRLSLQNISSGALTGTTLVDSETAGTLPPGCPVVPSPLAAGATYTCTYSATVSAGTTTNTAVARGPGAPVSASVSVTAAASVTLIPVLTDAIVHGVNRGTAGFTTRSVTLLGPGYVTYLVRLDPSLAGQLVTIWTRTRTGAWTRQTSRLVGPDGTLPYYLRISAWTGFWAKLDGGTSHGRIGTVR